MPTGIALNVVSHGFLAQSVLDDEIHDAHRLHLVGGIDATAQDYSLCSRNIKSPRQKVVCSHARKQVEQDFRQSKLRALFGNDEIARKSRLESTAKRITLDESNRNDRQMQTDCSTIDYFDTQIRIALQCFPICCSDAFVQQG